VRGGGILFVSKIWLFRGDGGGGGARGGMLPVVCVRVAGKDTVALRRGTVDAADTAASRRGTVDAARRSCPAAGTETSHPVSKHGGAACLAAAGWGATRAFFGLAGPGSFRALFFFKCYDIS
jgi:hypothetical protein